MLVQILSISRLKVSEFLTSRFMFLIVSGLMPMKPSAITAILLAEILLAKRTIWFRVS